jgi:hypothetical protein
MTQADHIMTLATGGTVAPKVVDRWMVDFRLPDRDELIEAVKDAAWRYCLCAGMLQMDPKDQRWQKLYERVRDTLDVIDTMRPELASRLGGQATAVDVFARSLRFAAPWVRRAQRGPKPRDAMRAALDVLAKYWVLKVGRKFTQDHVWPAGKGGRRVPLTEATRFTYAVIEYLLPGRGSDVQSLAKEFTLKQLADFEARAYSISS